LHIRRRKKGIQLLVSKIGADEKLSAVGRGDDLILVPLREVRPRRAVGVHNALRQKVQDTFVLVRGLVGGKQMIETAILTDDDHDMLDRRSRWDRVDGLIWILCGVANRPRRES